MRPALKTLVFLLAILGASVPARAQSDSLCLATVRTANGEVQRLACVKIPRDTVWNPRDSIVVRDSIRWIVRDSVVIRWIDSVRVDTTTPPDSTPPTDTLPPPPTDTTPPPPPPPPPPASKVAELPRSTPIRPTVEMLPCTVRVASASGLQAAFNAARGGTVICLPTGAVHRGNFTIPARSDTGWIVLRTDTIIPAGRMRPSTAAALRLAQIVSPNGFSALSFASRSRRTIVLGIEVTTDSVPAIGATALISVGTTQETNLADLPTDIGFDRVYLHGWPSQSVRRAVAGNGRSMWLERSWCSEIHYKGGDSQCWISWNGAGPILLDDNYLAAASENVMFGGGDPRVPHLVAEDITIRRNHIVKPSSWIGKAWLIKALMESKASRRVLVEENVFDGQWFEDAVGHAALTIKSSNQSGSCTRCDTSDWTIRRNLFQNIAVGFAIAGRADQDGGNLTDSTVRRIAIQENWFDSVSVPPYTSPTRAFVMFTSRNDGVLFAGNSVAGAGPGLESSILFNLTTGHQVPVWGLTMRDNILPRGRYGMIATGIGEGARAWAVAARPLVPGDTLTPPHSVFGPMAFLAPRAPSVAYPPLTSWHTTLSEALLAVPGAVTRSTVAAGVHGVVVLP